MGSDKPVLAATVVVPAHNEEAVLGRLLAALLPSRDSEGLHVVVVANGCTDQTAVVARSHPSVEVVELPFGNKQPAMRAGVPLVAMGRWSSSTPMSSSPRGRVGLVDAFAEPGVLAAAPSAGSTWRARLGWCGPTTACGRACPRCGSVSSVEE